MDESLSSAAREGYVKELYRLIHGDGNLLRNFDDLEFTNTPLHIATEEGCIDFAMEIMNLKPSFGWKLNQQGLSPIHLAIKNKHTKLVLRLIEINKDLIRVKGKKGKTPFHYLSKLGNSDDLLNRFLEACPNCIRDVTTKNQTALHIAVKNENLDVLQVLIRNLRNTDYCQEVVNQKDKDGNTPLHLAAAASNNQQHQMLKLLLRCKADKHATNEAGSTALEIAKHHNNEEGIEILRGWFIPGVSNFNYRLKKQIFKYITKASTRIFHDMDNISGEDRNALLVILGLLLTTTFQAGLNPPGSSNWQGDENKGPAKSMNDQYSFIFFYFPTCAVFIVTFFLTLALLKPFPRGFRTALQVLLAFLARLFYDSLYLLAPSELANSIIIIFSFLVFILMMFMCLNNRVSKTSLLILGLRLIPIYLFTGSGGSFVQDFVIASLFIFLYNDLGKGAFLFLGPLIISSVVYGLVIGLKRILLVFLVKILGLWLFLNLCRFCIQLCNRHFLVLNLNCVNV